MNLATQYLGIELRSPFVVGASPFCDDLDQAQRLEEAGAGALVMRSLFEEQFDGPLTRATAASRRCGRAGAFAEFATYQFSAEDYARQLTRLKDRVSIPVIASLNSTRPGTWIDFAARLEHAGADAIELNFYRVVTDVSIAADEVESDMLETVGRVTDAVRIPVAVKLSPFHTSLAQLAVALELAGAAGVVLFNRFYQPDVNTARVEVHPRLRLSDTSETLLRLRWLAILSPYLRCTLAATGGFHTADDVVKAILTGADAVQVVSVLLRHGPAALRTVADGLRAWMTGHDCRTLDDFRGRLNLRACGDASAIERANYIRTLQSWKR